MNHLRGLDADPSAATIGRQLAFRLKLLLGAGLQPELGACARCGASGPLVAFSGVDGRTALLRVRLVGLPDRPRAARGDAGGARRHRSRRPQSRRRSSPGTSTAPSPTSRRTTHRRQAARAADRGLSPGPPGEVAAAPVRAAAATSSAPVSLLAPDDFHARQQAREEATLSPLACRTYPAERERS